jgi:peptide methionine sulfoxide reductase MsrB
MGDESIMKQKKHGTSNTPVQDNLRWNVNRAIADRICNFNRHYAEASGYWTRSSTFLSDISEKVRYNEEDVTFYDSNTGKPLFIAPKGRSFQDFVTESSKHGWPSFRDDEVVWENVRCLPNGETVSVDGTHLGHNLPDAKGSRYCINLVSIAGLPSAADESR